LYLHHLYYLFGKGQFLLQHLLMLSRNYDIIYPICFLVCHTSFAIPKTILATAPHQAEVELMKSDQ